MLRRSLSCMLLAGLALLFTPSRAADLDPKAITITLPDQIHWQVGPNNDTATLQGDPSKPGLYVQMLRWHKGNMSRPHMHATDRYIYVVSGTWWLGSGPNFDPASTVPIKAGTFVVHHAGQLHYDGAKDEDCVIYIVGMGPVSAPQVGKAGK